MGIYLDIDKLRYDIYKRCEDCFLSVLDGVYCYKDLNNNIVWMKRVGCMRRFACRNFQIITTADGKLSYTVLQLNAVDYFK